MSLLGPPRNSSLRAGGGRSRRLRVLSVALAGWLAAVPVGAAAADFPIRDAGYHSYAEMVAEVDAVVAAHPDIVRRLPGGIGRSVEGRELVTLKVSDHPDLDEPEPELLFDGLHHASEHMGAEMMLSLLHLLTDGYGEAGNEELTALVDSREVWLVMMVNPDGGEYDLTGDPYRGWRKNRQSNGPGLAVGTDLNRNYGYRWGCCSGSSPDPASSYYRGPSPFSAPETRAMRDFVKSRVVGGIQQIRVAVTFHTSGRLMLYPYGYTRIDLPGDMTRDDHAAFVALSGAMADTNGYVPEQASDLYVDSGTFRDWLYGRYRIFAWTFELSAGAYPDDSTIPAETGRNRAAMVYLLRQAACPHAAVASLIASHCGPFSDDMEIARGWQVDAAGTDTATSGAWERAVPQPSIDGARSRQPGAAYSGRRAFVTGRLATADPAANDLDGHSTALSRSFALAGGQRYRIAFRGYLAHDAASTEDDALRLWLVPPAGTPMLVYQRIGGPFDVAAAWTSRSATFTAPVSGPYRIRLEAQDGGPDGLVEAGVDDLWIAEVPEVAMPTALRPGVADR